MSAIRRDLIERKLWRLVALLLVGVVAVPFLLLKGSSADGVPAAAAPAPPAAPAAASATPATPATSTTAHATAKAPATVAWSDSKRNPFASGSSASTSSTTTTGTTAGAPAAAASSPSSGSSASAAAAAMVTPSPAAGSASSGSGSTTGSASATSSTPHTSSSAPVSTIASATAEPAVKAQSWTTYGVSVRFGKDTGAPLRSDLARLTPLPSARQPLVMFVGMLSNGRQAVFALGHGVQHTGPGWCRPSRTQCAAILLKAGQTEHVTVPATGGAQGAATASVPSRQLILRVVRIRASITHSHKVALAAYQRYSSVGQCELDLSNPVAYNQTTGTLSTVATAACHAHPHAVPFSYAVSAP
jgi:hypothetical protein